MNNSQRFSLGTLINALVVAGAALIAGTVGSYWYANKDGPIMTYVAQPYVTDSHGFVRQTYRAGEAVILHLRSRRNAGECWAEYYTVLDGPVIHAYPARRSQLISDKQIEADLNLFFAIPDSLPSGTYNVLQIVYPTCYGISARPFTADMKGVTITVE